LRILHLISTLDSTAGGPSNSIRRIVASYPAIGSVGEVLTLDDPSAPFLRELGFKVHALGPVSTKFGYSRRLIPWLRAERTRFDGVVVHGLWQFIGYAARRTMQPDIPYLVFPHGMLDPYFKRAYPAKYVKKLSYWWSAEYRVLRDAHRVLFTSETEARLATESFRPWRWHAKVVPYGACAPTGDPDTLREAFLDRLPKLRAANGRARRFLLFLGRIHPKKGCDLLLDAFACIAPAHPDVHLVFAGPDNDGLRSELTSRASSAGLADRMHWPGMLDGEQKWGAFYACEAFCLPSHQENFGIAVAEALACGKPVLISDKVNIWEEIVADGAGLAGPDTLAGTLGALERWLALAASEKDALAERALDCFRRRYDMGRNASGIVEIFTQNAAQNPAQ
jgi:glycosyltransferase involved in cell wall biosynthesis